MSIRFAGSRFVHERRRRRLAQECGGVSMVPVEFDADRSDDDAETALPLAATQGRSPVNRIIRPQLWVHWTITVLCFAAWGGMLYLGDVAEQTGIGLQDILGIRSGRLASFFSTIMLLWAGQLSLLIYWYRRKNGNDFQGRYRVWLWVAAMLQMFLAVAATGAHLPFSQYIQSIWPLDIPMYGLLCWLVPVATLSLAMYRLLRIELKRHRSGLFLLSVAGIAGLTAAGSLVIGPILPDRLRDLIQIGSATLAHLGLATALLMHARYVVHICNEAPRKERRTRRMLIAVRTAAGYLPLPKSPRLKLPRVAMPKLSAVKARLPKVRLPKLPFRKLSQSASPKAVADEAPRTAKTRKREPRQQAPSKNGKSRATSKPQSAVETKAVLTSRKKKSKPPQNAEQRRVDTAKAPAEPRQRPHGSLDAILDEYGGDKDIDSETLRGLSKKQRRRLRKKQRELQQAGR